MTPSDRPMVQKLKPVPPVRKPPKPVCCSPAEMKDPLLAVLGKLQAARKRPLFVLVGGYIGDDICGKAHEWKAELRSAATPAGFDVLIHSPGGALTSCYQVARLFARVTNSWEALVPAVATSGATLICLGSASMVMSEMAQLGPIDPQVISKRHERFLQNERQSPLEAFQAMKYLREQAFVTIDLGMKVFLDAGVTPKHALDAATSVAHHLTQPILSKIEAYDLGALALDNNLSLNYCGRIANPRDRAKKAQRGVNFKAIVENYPAHEFVIDIEEARALGFAISEPVLEVDSVFDELRPLLDKAEHFIGFVPTEEGASDETGEVDAS